jgi:hypothetical protein
MLLPYLFQNVQEQIAPRRSVQPALLLIVTACDILQLACPVESLQTGWYLVMLKRSTRGRCDG